MRASLNCENKSESRIEIQGVVGAESRNHVRLRRLPLFAISVL